MSVIISGHAHGVTVRPTSRASIPVVPTPQGPFLMMATTRDKLLTQEPPSPPSSSATFSPWSSWSIQGDPTASGPGTLQVQGADSAPPPGRTFTSPLLMLLLLLSGHSDPATTQRAPQDQAWHPKSITSSQQSPRQEKSQQFTYNRIISLQFTSLLSDHCSRAAWANQGDLGCAMSSGQHQHSL